MTNFLIVLDVILGVILLGFLGFWAYNRIQAKRLGGELTNEEFKAGMRKSQIIDVREANEFKHEHIDGARNIPYTMFKYQYTELRPDLPVYLYSDSLTMTMRCASILRKHNVDMYICGHIHNFQHIRVPGSDIDYVVNSAASLARKVEPIEGTKFCSPEPGFSVCSIDKKELNLRMIDKKGNVLYTVTRKK